jgi:phospholipid-binding lipoprotein MlaA
MSALGLPLVMMMGVAGGADVAPPAVTQPIAIADEFSEFAWPTASFTEREPIAIPKGVPPSVVGELVSPANTPSKATEPTEHAAGAVAPDPGDIVVSARQDTPGDPLQAMNQKSFELTQSVDRTLIRPAAMAYTRLMPLPIADGVRNVLNNLQGPDVFVNFLLQHRIGKAAHVLVRFAINSTIGIGGLFDVARRKPFQLRRLHNGFADTMGYYGVKPGAFLYLPIIGPTTVRDLIGTNIDRFLLPIAAGRPFNKPYYALPVGLFRTLDHRAQFDDKLAVLHSGSDPYADTRNDYVQDRQDEIDHLHSKAWQARHGIAPK